MEATPITLQRRSLCSIFKSGEVLALPKEGWACCAGSEGLGGLHSHELLEFASRRPIRCLESQALPAKALITGVLVGKCLTTSSLKRGGGMPLNLSIC